MRRRDFLAVTAGCLASPLSAFGQHGQMPTPVPSSGTTSPPVGPADVELRIAPVSWDLAPGRTIKTLAYNDAIPGPLLRVPRGRPLTVDVVNNTADTDIVHWHGLHIPSDVDGAVEEGTPPVAARGRQRYVFTPEPAGTRWYHSHVMPGRDLRKGPYSGQFGVLIIEGGDDPGHYDADVPIVLHEFEPRFNAAGDVEARYFSINGRSLGGGEPVRVKANQRVLFRIVNASATVSHQLALAGHLFEVVALDGNPVPTRARVQVVDVAPGERVDAVVEMNRPGVWTLGAIRNDWRQAGLGIVVEYADAQGPPQWSTPSPAAFTWDYGLFARPTAAGDPDERLTMVFRPVGDGHHWTINGKSYPKADPIVVREGARYRWLLDNQSAEAHPIHLHRHTIEVVKVDGRVMSGVMKDVVVVPAWKQVEVDVSAVHPGLSLFHCHQQFHMDMGFMTMMRYST
ncbi:MAG: multicopper oxidase domain-containing protein [Vicinamibacterales bacterium]